MCLDCLTLDSDCLICDIDCLVCDLDIRICGLDCLVDLDCLICGLDCLVRGVAREAIGRGARRRAAHRDDQTRDACVREMARHATSGRDCLTHVP